MNTSQALQLEAALLSSATPQRERAAYSRDAASFDRLVVEEQAYVARLVARLVGWQSDVDDLVQEVFVAALRAWPRFRGDCAARTWLTRIAVNKCRSHARRRWLRERLLAPWHAGGEAAARVESRPPADRDVADAVRRAVEQLGQRDREVIVLHHLQQLPAAEIATMLNIRRNAVEVRLTRARQRLKQILTGTNA